MVLFIATTAAAAADAVIIIVRNNPRMQPCSEQPLDVIEVAENRFTTRAENACSSVVLDVDKCRRANPALSRVSHAWKRSANATSATRASESAWERFIKVQSGVPIKRKPKRSSSCIRVHPSAAVCARVSRRFRSTIPKQTSVFPLTSEGGMRGMQQR